jgi:hypothetical protein
MPYDKNGKFYTTRLGDDLKGPNAGERLNERAANAKRFAKVGGKVGSVVPLGGTAVGTALGAIGGFILGDQETVFPIDMIAIPAYQAFMIQGTPAFQIYIKEGEVLTQVIPTDAMEASEAVNAVETSSTPKKRKKSKYHAAYGKNFRKLAPKYKLKSGAWAKDGFKRCRDAAHKMTKKEMK